MTITLATDGGNHPPGKWAYTTARMVLNLEPAMDAEKLVTGQSLQAKAAVCLTKHYADVIAKESENLKMFVNHCDRGYDVQAVAEIAVKEIQALAVGSPWEKQINTALWALHALETIGNHFASAIHVERLLHGDNNPTNASAAAYKLKHNGI